jgi:hypothetical protein
VNDFTGVAREGAEQGAVSVHDDEAKLLVRLKQLAQGFGVELVVAKVQRRVDGLEGLEVDVDLALLAFGGDDFTAVDDEAIRGDLGVELQTLLGGRDGREHGETVDTGLDVGGGAKLFGQHLGGARDLVLGRCACQRPPEQPASAAYSRMMSEIMDVPFPRAASRRLMSFLTFQISMFFSASLGCCSFDDMVAAGEGWVCGEACDGGALRDFLVREGQGTRVAGWRRERPWECAMRLSRRAGRGEERCSAGSRGQNRAGAVCSQSAPSLPSPLHCLVPRCHDWTAARQRSAGAPRTAAPAGRLACTATQRAAGMTLSCGRPSARCIQ